MDSSLSRLATSLWLVTPLAAALPAPPVAVLQQVIAAKDVCAWPKLALQPNGDVVAAIYNRAVLRLR